MIPDRLGAFPAATAIRGGSGFLQDAGKLPAVATCRFTIGRLPSRCRNLLARRCRQGLRHNPTCAHTLTEQVRLLQRARQPAPCSTRGSAQGDRTGYDGGWSYRRYGFTQVKRKMPLPTTVCCSTIQPSTYCCLDCIWGLDNIGTAAVTKTTVERRLLSDASDIACMLRQRARSVF